MKNQKLISITLIICLALAVTACSNKDADKNTSETVNKEGVVATVNGEEITQEQYDESLAVYKKLVENQYGEGAWDVEISPGETIGSYYANGVVLDNMILEMVLMDAAQKEGVVLSEEDIQTELEEYKAYLFTSDDEYKTFLETNNMTEEYLKESIKKEQTINNFIQVKIESLAPEDKELEELFKELRMGQQVRASHILVETEDEAKNVKERLNKGENFEDIAKEISVDTGSAGNGGDLDFFNYSDMVKPFAEAAFSMDVNEISAPVQSEFGYHIIKVTDKKTDETVTVESSKDTLKETFKSIKYQELIEKLKSEADIVKK